MDTINRQNKTQNFEMNFTNTASALKQLLNKQKQEKFSFLKFKILIPYLNKYPGHIVIIILTSIISAIVLLPVPILTQYIIDKYIKNDDIKMIFWTSIIITGLYIFSFFIKVILNYFFSLLNNKLLFSIKQDLTEKIISLPLSFFTETQSGYLVSRINEINQLGSMFSLMFISLVVSSLSFIGSLIILGFLGWQILVLTLFFLPVQYLIVKKFTGGLQNVSKTMMENSALLNKNMQEVVSGIQTVKSFATEDKEKNKIRSSMHSVYKNSLLQNIFIGISQEIIGFVSNFSNLIVLSVSALLIINKQFTIGMYVACLQYVSNIFRPVQSFASAGIIMQPMIVAINRISEYFQIIGEDNSLNRRIMPESFKGEIVFENLSFFYEKNKIIFNKISFIINPGEKIVINGPNGSGKTTLIKLLLQLHLPQEGTIKIDEQDISFIDLTILRKKIGLVSQDVFLFNDTIKNNLLYGGDDFSKPELENIINKFCSFINKLPEGIDTMVGERGNNLSGGQKQAISIVRAIIKRPDILIFDEGNTNLDTQSKMILIDLVNQYFSDKTCIFISHEKFIFNKPTRTITLENYILKCV
jgi:ATP-binding cassette, subfamily B, bacterial